MYAKCTHLCPYDLNCPRILPGNAYKTEKKIAALYFLFFQPNRNVISVLLLTILDGNKKCPVFKFILVTGGTKVENYPIFQFLVCLFQQCSYFEYLFRRCKIEKHTKAEQCWSDK